MALSQRFTVSSTCLSRSSSRGATYTAIVLCACQWSVDISPGAAPADHPVLQAQRTDQPPVIDGDLGDAVWQTAPVIDAFRQVIPVEGAAPTELTEVRLLYDDDALYVAFRCFDSNPKEIIGKVMARDGSIGSDDRVRFVIDTFLDRRNAFYFEMNPVGARIDALIEDNRRFRREWDGIWFGRTRITDTGWAAEFAIPFKTVTFDPEHDRWGFNAERIIRRKTETVRWSGYQQNRNIEAIGDAGTIEGLTGMTQGAGIDVKPFSTTSITSREGEEHIDLDAGLDVFLRTSTSSTLAITINTDFAETEVDERRINLTRFPLFFPEKRDFFLQDAGIFNFGGINFNPLAFQSRRIGIGAGGQTQDILGGIKFTGRSDDLSYGILSVQMQEDDELGNKNLSIARASLNVLEESTIGFIATAGDPGVRGDNFVAGADFNFRDSTWGGGSQVVTGNLWYQQSWTDNASRDDRGGAVGFKLGYPNDRVNWSIGFTRIDDEFNPALGFVPRGGIHEYFANWRYRWRPNNGIIRRVDSGLRLFLITSLQNNVESQDVSLNALTIETEDNNVLSLNVNLVREVLDAPFEISSGVSIPAGDHRYERINASYATSSSNPVSFNARFEAGDFFTGTRLDTSGSIDWRVSSNLQLGIEYEQNDVDLPEGDFTTRIVRGRVNVYFTPDISWTNFVQYDNVSDSVGLNSRVRWIVEPGNEVFFVLNQALDVNGTSFSSDFTQFTTKVGWTFRF